MTEAEWLACDNPSLMLDARRSAISMRKARLFAVACCRRIWHLLDSPKDRELVQLVERLADDVASRAEWATALDALNPQLPAVEGRQTVAGRASHAAYALILPTFPDAASLVAFQARTAVRLAEGLIEDPLVETPHPERERQAALLRCVDNPFHSTSIRHSWLTSDVLSVLWSAYSTGEFSCTPILADALEEAGCTDDAILSHLRSPGPHVRGCWAVDLILGKQ